MTELSYDKEITALLVIDPYNDFISEGGFVWDRVKGLQKPTTASRTCGRFSTHRARQVCVSSTRFITGTGLVTMRRGSTLRRCTERTGEARYAKTVPGAARSARNSGPTQATSSPGSIGPSAALPTPIWISSSKSTGSTV